MRRTKMETRELLTRVFLQSVYDAKVQKLFKVQTVHD